MRKKSVLVAAAVVVGSTIVTAGPAVAGQVPQDASCDGVSVTITTPSQNSTQNGGWSVGRVVGANGSHYIPTSFSLVATDLNTAELLVVPFGVKGNGHANHNQQQVTCSFPDTDPSDAGLTVGDLEMFTETSFDADPSDPISLAFTVTAVPVTK